jgi:DNA-binding NtrC family response regulator
MAMCEIRFACSGGSPTEIPLDSQEPKKTIRTLSDKIQDILDVEKLEFLRIREIPNLMMSELLTSIARDEISTRREWRNGAVLRCRIEAISALVSALNTAVDDLESFELPMLNDGLDFYDEVRRFEIALIRKALRLTRGSQVQAAKLLKLNATTLSTKIKNYRICAQG